LQKQQLSAFANATHICTYVQIILGASMSIAELIALASVRSGKRQKALAEEMGHADSTRLSKISSGRLSADASEIVYLAGAAELPAIETLARIESERHPELAGVWKKVIAQDEQWRKRRDSNPR
jgi:hypothetical protein